MKLGESKAITLVITFNKRGYFINVDNHRTIGPLDEEPTFQEALALYETIEALDRSVGVRDGSNE